jgi:hypothetical protein
MKLKKSLAYRMETDERVDLYPSPGFQFGDQKFDLHTVLLEPETRFRLQDEEARRKKAEENIAYQERPFVSQKTIKDYLAGKNNYQIFEPEEGEVQNNYTFFFAQNKRIGPHPEIKKVIKNIKRYRMMAVDTECTTGRIFLIIGDFEGTTSTA